MSDNKFTSFLELDDAPVKVQPNKSVFSDVASLQPKDGAKAQQDALKPFVAESDVVITTAAVPGRKAPLLVTQDMARAMKLFHNKYDLLVTPTMPITAFDAGIVTPDKAKFPTL